MKTYYLYFTLSETKKTEAWKPVRLSEKKAAELLRLSRQIDIDSIFKKGKNWYAIHLNGVTRKVSFK